MSTFFYKAKHKNNKIEQGSITAQNITQAAMELERKGLIVLELKEESPRNNTNLFKDENYNLEFSLSEKKEFFNSFYYLYKSGISINEIFRSILNTSQNKKIKFFCKQILNKTEKGYSLKETLTKNSNKIGIAYATLITAGEESGKLDNILPEIINNIKREEEIKHNIISSLTYPCFIFCLAIFVFCLFKFFILKIFSAISNSESYVISELLFSCIIKIIFVYAVLFCIIFLCLKKGKDIKNFFSKFSPFSNIIKNYYFTNFFSIFSLAYEAGVPILESMNIASSAINIGYINKRLKKSIIMLSQGCELTTALNVANIFSSYAISQISSGEQAGELGKMLQLVSKDYEKNLDLSIKIILKAIEPLMILFIGLLVLYIAYTAYKSYYDTIFSLL